MIRPLVAAAAAAALLAPIPAQVRILCLGDSITDSITTAQPSYRFPLWTMLAGATCVDFVGFNVGVANGQRPVGADRFDQDYSAVSGITANAVAGFLQTWLQPSPPPPPPGMTADFALIHLGTNDILLRPSTRTVAANTAQIVSDLNTIINALRVFEPGLTPVVAQIIPTASAATNAEIVQLNQALATAGALPSGTLLANAFQGYHGVGDNQPDGVHPNSGGENKIATAFHSVIQPLLLAPIGFACFEQFGFRCSSARPRLSQAGGRPLLGATFAMAVDGVQATTSVFGVMSQTDLVPPVPLGAGAPECMQLVNTSSSTFLGPGTAPAQLQLVIPNNPALVGTTVFAQAWAFGGGLNAADMVTSNAGIIRIGNV